MLANSEIVWFTGKLVLVKVEKVVLPLILLDTNIKGCTWPQFCFHEQRSVILLFYAVNELLSVEIKTYECLIHWYLFRQFSGNLFISWFWKDRFANIAWLNIWLYSFSFRGGYGGGSSNTSGSSGKPHSSSGGKGSFPQGLSGRGSSRGSSRGPSGGLSGGRGSDNYQGRDGDTGPRGRGRGTGSGGRGRGEARKVQMQQLHMTVENQELVRDVLRELQGIEPTEFRY